MNLKQSHMPAMPILALGHPAFVMTVLCLALLAGAHLFEGAAICLVCLAVAHGEGAAFVAGREMERDMNGLADGAGERSFALPIAGDPRQASPLARIQLELFRRKGFAPDQYAGKHKSDHFRWFLSEIIKSSCVRSAT